MNRSHLSIAILRSLSTVVRPLRLSSRLRRRLFLCTLSSVVFLSSTKDKRRLECSKLASPSLETRGHGSATSRTPLSRSLRLVQLSLHALLDRERTPAPLLPRPDQPRVSRPLSSRPVTMPSFRRSNTTTRIVSLARSASTSSNRSTASAATDAEQMPPPPVPSNSDPDDQKGASRPHSPWDHADHV